MHVSDIPYHHKFGSVNGRDEDLSQYLNEMKEQRLGDHPWYVFKGHHVPDESNRRTSLVAPAVMQVPPVVAEAFTKLPLDRPGLRRRPKRPPTIDEAAAAEAYEEAEAETTVWSPKEAEEVARRAIFQNIQWAVGTKGSGAPVHFHNTAWNQLFYGKKHWYLFPPSRNLMGNKQVLQWLEEDLPRLRSEGFVPLECVQEAGDVLIVPELWGHAVLNTQDSIAVACEVDGGVYRPPAPAEVSALVPRNKGSGSDLSSRRSYWNSRGGIGGGDLNFLEAELNEEEVPSEDRPSLTTGADQAERMPAAGAARAKRFARANGMANGPGPAPVQASDALEETQRHHGDMNQERANLQEVQKEQQHQPSRFRREEAGADQKVPGQGSSTHDDRGAAHDDSAVVAAARWGKPLGHRPRGHGAELSAQLYLAQSSRHSTDNLSDKMAGGQGGRSERGGDKERGGGRRSDDDRTSTRRASAADDDAYDGGGKRWRRSRTHGDVKRGGKGRKSMEDVIARAMAAQEEGEWKFGGLVPNIADPWDKR